MKKLNVLVSAYACNPLSSIQFYPGEDTIGWKLVEQLGRFHNVWVITHSYNREPISKALNQRKVSGVNFYFIDLPSSLRLLNKAEFGIRIYYYLWQIRAWRIAERLHQKFNIDLAHHITFGNDWMPSFIGALLPIPFIWGPIGGGQKTPRGLKREYSLYGQFAEGVRSVSQWFGRNDYFRRRCIKQARVILVCNEETKAKIPIKYQNKIYFFPVNGVSSEDIKSKSNDKIPQNPFLILTAGRLHRLKGFLIAIKSFAIFSKKFPDSKLIIIGKGPEENRLQRQIQDLGLQSKVKIYQWMPHEKFIQMIRSCHVFIFPSFRDGGGAVVVEAMASGKPVVCLDVGGPGFHIQPEWGIKISPKNPEYVVQEMAKALEKLHLNKELQIKMGEAARKRAEEFYLWDRLGERLQEIYGQALPNTETNRADSI